jgi:eukaryotic-like serine/threonine-protein kinase
VESSRTLIHGSPGGEVTAAEAPARRIARRAPRADSSEQTLPVAARELPAPQLVLGRYQLLERLGSGGFGVVWHAHDEMLHREVALKRIWLGPDGDRERATREAHASARLAHPAIVALYEACVVEEAFYLISELVEGDTLAQLIAEGDLQDEEVLEIGLALTEALAHAHGRGVIHRDIKPQNVLVPHRPGKGGQAAKLTDFGGASLVGEDALTRTGDVLGTLAYMAPEQSEGRTVGEEADLYALALVLYEALAGVNPVRGATPAATARRIGRPLERLARHRRDLPRALTEAIDGALAPTPEDRGSLEHLRLVLEETLEQGLQERPRRGPRPALAQDVVGRTWEAPAIGAPAGHPRARGWPLRKAHLEQTPGGLLEEGLPMALAGGHLEERPSRLTLPRALWMALALAGAIWQAWIGHPGVALLALTALAPLIVLPSEPRSNRVGAAWLVAALAPILGFIGLAAAYPALAGQGSRWRERAVHGALGYWWLVLAEPLLGRRLWLGIPAGMPPRAVWESSISSTATHLIAPDLSLGVLLGALLWGCGATALPWLVRGGNATLDALAAALWSAALLAATPILDGGLALPLSHPSPRGLVLGAVLGALVAVGARALRGPV